MATQNDRMTILSGEVTSFAGKADKKPWTVPVIQSMAINAALGHFAGPRADKFGALSAQTP